MTETHIAFSDETDSQAAGRQIGREMRSAFDGAAADAIVVFASARHDYGALLRSLRDEAGTNVIAGASSAGEFTQAERGEGKVSALGIRSSSMRFGVALGRGVSVDAAQAAEQVAGQFRGAGAGLPHRSALVMSDALAGHMDQLVEELSVRTGGAYTFFGGGAGDDGKFQSTHVFAGTEAVSDAVVALEILSDKPVGVGVSHGWIPTGKGFRVTEAEGTRLVSLNGEPAVEAFRQRAMERGQPFDPKDPLPFFLHNILGIREETGFRLRVPLGVNPDGSVVCAAEVPEGSMVHLMDTTAASAVEAARQATASALQGLAGGKPAAALVFDCVATRLRLGKGFQDELQACRSLLEPAGFVGCNTYGQIARAGGQFSGFHNCTAVVCVLPG